MPRSNKKASAGLVLESLRWEIANTFTALCQPSNNYQIWLGKNILLYLSVFCFPIQLDIYTGSLRSLLLQSKKALQKRKTQYLMGAFFWVLLSVREWRHMRIKAKKNIFMMYNVIVGLPSRHAIDTGFRWERESKNLGDVLCTDRYPNLL